jgi:hypothetical protein
MTPGGELMLRVKAMVVLDAIPWTLDHWRLGRAEGLARMIAYHRIDRTTPGAAMLRRFVLDDIIPDIGWPRLSWLKRQVRDQQREIVAIRKEFRQLFGDSE